MFGYAHLASGKASFSWWFQALAAANKYHLLTQRPGAALTTGVARSPDARTALSGGIYEVVGSALINSPAIQQQ